MVDYIVVTFGKNPSLFDTYYNKIIKLTADNVRQDIRQYINDNKLDVISIHEITLPDKTQLMIWYRSHDKPTRCSRNNTRLDPRGNQESLSKEVSEVPSGSWGRPNQIS